MFYVRPIARKDLPALLALSERSGAALTTLPANAERLAQRIERSFAAFAGNAAKADACYVFVLIDGGSGSVVGISAIQAAVGLSEPCTTNPSGRRVHACAGSTSYRPGRPFFLPTVQPGTTDFASLFPISAY